MRCSRPHLRRPRLSELVILVAVASAACASHARPAVSQRTAPGAGAVEQLRGDLRAIFSDPVVQHAQWGIEIVSLRTSETLYSDNAYRFFLPASNQKLLTTAVAAERLGWDYQFTTRVFGTGPIDSDGTLNGNLVVVGNGDPSINPRHPDRWRAFDDWARTLVGRGIRIVNGHIIGDDNAFEEPGWGQGWTWENLAYGFGTAIGALQYNENQIELLVGPGLAPGARAIISSSPPGHGLLIDNLVATAASGTPTSVDIARQPGTSLLQVQGQIASDAKPVTITASVENPTRLYVSALREALARHGVFVSDTAIDVDELRGPLDVSKATELIVDRSPKLSELIDVAMKWSRNEYAETFLRALSAAGKPASAAAGLDAVREQLTAWGIPAEFYLARDGSGLSRMDYVSPHALTALLTHIWKDPRLAETFKSVLPVAGVSGTLADRMKGTPAESRVFAKTGSLSNVRALSGYLITFSGEPIVFSIIANNYHVPTSKIDELTEKALIRVIQAR